MVLCSSTNFKQLGLGKSANIFSLPLIRFLSSFVENAK